MKKKILAVSTAAALTLSMVGCGGAASSTAAPASSAPASSAPAAQAEETLTPAQKAVAEAEAAGVWLSFDEEGNTKRTDRDVTAENGAVAASNYYASKAGLDVLQAGGNAVDAAVAVAYTLGVAEPSTSGLGGGGFMVIYDAASGTTEVVDYREVAPQAATAEMWLEEGADTPTVAKFVDPDGNVFDGSYSKQSQVGGKAAGVPGQVAGMEYALENYGSGNLSRQEVMQPAIDLATEGFLVTPFMSQGLEDEYYEIAHMDEIAGYYLDEAGMPLSVGTVYTNPDLAASLQLIAEGGKDAFYTGDMAQAIVDTVQKYGGVMTMDDLANYEVKARTPVQSTYRDYTIVSCPPASSGGTHLIEILNMMETYDVASMEVNSTEYCHMLSECFKIAFADRSAYMADTDFTSVPLEGLTSKEYAVERAAEIDDTTSGSYTAGEPERYESMSTTSFSVMDKDGNMVACTQTINDFYGSKVAIDGYGFIMNDEMDDFAKDPASANCVEGGKRPLSSMSPTIVLDPNGDAFMTVGTPGATRIFPTIVQVISHVIDHGMDIQEAIDQCRIYDNSSETICYESEGTNPVTAETVAELEAMGHATDDRGAYAIFFGGVQGITVQDGVIRGGADPRRDGKALGY